MAKVSSAMIQTYCIGPQNLSAYHFISFQFRTSFARMINFRCKIGKSIKSGKKSIKLDEIEAEDLRICGG